MIEVERLKCNLYDLQKPVSLKEKGAVPEDNDPSRKWSFSCRA